MNTDLPDGVVKLGDVMERMVMDMIGDAKWNRAFASAQRRYDDMVPEDYDETCEDCGCDPCECCEQDGWCEVCESTECECEEHEDE